MSWSLPSAQSAQPLDLTDKVFEVVHKVFGDSSRFSKQVQTLIKNYFTFEEILHLSDERIPFRSRFSILSPFPKFVNFTQAEILKPYLQGKCQNRFSLSLVLGLVKLSYEVPARAIEGNKPYGCVFPMYPEVLAYAFQLNKKDVVLEVGGAHGIQALPFAFTHTKKVIVNDIDDELLDTYEKFKKLLPVHVSNKLESIRGSCFELLNVRPDLKNAVDLIFCRNLIHYFSDQELATFFTLLSKMLKVGGSAILTACSKYSFKSKEHIFNSNPDTTCYTVIHVVIHDYVNSYTKKIAIGSENHLFCMKESEFVLYNKKTGSGWAVNKTEYNLLVPKIKSLIKGVCDSNKNLLKSMDKGTVKVILCMRRLFDEITLSQLAHGHGFEVDCAFLIQENGHLMDKELYDNGNRHIGIACKKVKV